MRVQIIRSGSTALIIVVICLIAIRTEAQNLTSDWIVETGDKVLASPVSGGRSVFVGGQDGVMYAIDAATGSVDWKYETGGIIQAQALLTENVLFFESANVFYALEPVSGKLLWKYDVGMSPLGFEYGGRKFEYKLDFWDDKRSAGTLHEGVIYIGCGNGTLYGFREKDGELVFSASTDESSPIRSTPFVNNAAIYFGDWEGVVYAYDLATQQLKWKKKTYRGGRPYPSFGGVVSSFVSYKNMLFFGARNHMLNVLWEETGEKEWTYTDPKGGWLVGDPVITNDTLYIGGSDNFSMYAFGPNNGRFLWKHNGGKNIYTRPIITEDHLVYTAGNSYNWKDKGIIYLLDRKTGSELAKLELPNAVFSSPAMAGNRIIFGCYDGNIYSVLLEID